MTIRPLLTRLLVAGLILGTMPAYAANRAVTITAPAEVRPGASLRISIAASTDVVDGEQIGFLHSEISLDGGKTWASFWYAEKQGRSAARSLDLAAGPAGSKILVRTRVAFRGGKAGDVDFKGGAIQWDDSWDKWRTPPTKIAIIYVR